MTLRMPLFSLLLAFISAASLHAGDRVHASLLLKPHSEMLKGKEATLRMRRVNSVASIQMNGADVQQPATIGDPHTMDLEPGYWAVTVDGPGVWSTTQFVTVSPNSSPVVDVWPSAQLTGGVRFEDGATAKDLQVFLSRVGVSDAPEWAEASCAIRDSRFRCVIPAGKFDLRVHAPKFISHFFRSIDVKPAAAHDLGTISLRVGQSILGRIELPRGMKREEIARTVVQAAPAALGDGVQPLFSGANLIPLKGIIDAEGRFQVEGLPPGPYLVSASHATGMYSDVVRVTIRPGTEIQIVQPLRLDRARHLSLVIDPPVDYAGKAWHVRLNHDVTEHRAETVTESNASTSGAWDSPALHPGTYTVRVGSADAGSTWYAETFEVTNDTTKAIRIPAVRVRGRVTIGGKPLQAHLVFADRAGRRIGVPSDSDGTYRCALPDRGTDAKWDVQVNADTPTVVRTLRNLPIKTAADVDESTLDIDVPASLIMGIVVDGDGTPIPKALVNISQEDGGEPLMQGRTAQDGSFAIHGVANGSYSVSASAFMKESTPLHFDMREDAEPEPMRLVVKDVRKIKGIVVSDLGPVAGARVLLLPTDVDYLFEPTRTTDVQGVFDAWIPADCKEFDLFVAPQGFTYTIDHLTYQEGRSLSVRVYQRGGTLNLRDSNGLLLVHGGGMTDPVALSREWGAHSDAGDGGKATLVAEMMEPGPYSLCKVTQSALFRRTNGAAGGDCVSGFLPPSGTLTLKMP